MLSAFEIHVSDEVLRDLYCRLTRTRWLDSPIKPGWAYGTNLAYLKELVAYWRDGFNWRAQELELNRFAHFQTALNGYKLHFIHQRGRGAERIPLLLLHGWPDSFYRFHKMIPMLADPGVAGIDADVSFDVVVPSLPGFGWTNSPAEIDPEQPLRQYAALLRRLMTETLGYDRFVVAGGDGGSVLAQIMAVDDPESVAAIYLTDLGWNRMTADPGALPPAAKRYLAESKKLFMKESAYVMVQSTKPQTLAYPLNDSPAGLAAWIVEKFQSMKGSDDL